MVAEVFDLVIIGMGSAGVTAAEFATRLDLQVAVVERARIGGDCLWTGCVPSKAMLAAAKAAHTMRTADRFGLDPVEPSVDLSRVWRRIRSVQRDIAEHEDNPQRFRELGAEVVDGTARVTAADEVTVDLADGTQRVLATRFVLVCTGSRPHVPDIAGLPAHATWTSDTLFDIDAPPRELAIVGGGPMGVELAQGLQRLGVRITLLQRAHTLLPREDRSVVERLTRLLEAEGVTVHCSADVRNVRPVGGRWVVDAVVGDRGQHVEVAVDGIVVAAGRVPNSTGLGLEALGVEVDGDGIRVDAAGRTAVRSIYAVGDVTAGPRLTNSAGYAAVVAVRDMFFPGRGAADGTVPSCTFTDPELARVGLTIEDAEAMYGADADAYRLELSHNDRARTDAATAGVLVVVTGRGKVVGAHLLAPNAGEMVHELAVAVQQGMRLDDLADVVHAYPTIAGGIGQLAAEAAYEKAHRLRWLMKRR